ncbi:MAG: DoxX family protein [Flavobacteriales bacterium]|nr:DoxX family protein [Flavobacteriales bacterium]
MKNKWINNGLKILFILCIAGPIYGKITQNEQFLESFTGLGYPAYLSQILLVAYLLGIAAIFQSKYLLLKEWAYTGFTFALIGAFISHVFVADSLKGLWALVTLVFLLGSYFFEKKLKSNT